MTSDRLPRKLTAILYADVASYSRLTGLGEDTKHRRLSSHLDFISETSQIHNGRVIHYAGNAVLARFDAVAIVVSAAVTIQNHLQLKKIT